MTSLLAIALLEVRAAFRSRLFLALVLVLLAVGVGLPMTVRGDGTAAGRMHMLLYYTLGLSAFILGTATLWVSCASISEEIREKQIQLTVTKPVHGWQIWAGKWVGILICDAMLLTLTGLILYGFVRRDLAGMPERDRARLRDEVLVGRRVVSPQRDLAAVDLEVGARIERQRQEGRIPADGLADATAQERKRVLAEQSVVAAGQGRQWDLPVSSEHALRGTDVALRFRFISTLTDRKRVAGTWTVSRENGGEPFRVAMSNRLDGTHTLELPASAMQGTGMLRIRYDNAPKGQSNAMIFDLEQPVELLIDESRFEANLARALLLVFFQMALLAALGLTAGSFFSFPVATFIAASLIVIATAGHYTTLATSPRYAVHDHGEGPSWFETAAEGVAKRMNRVVGPTLDVTPMGRLSDGLLLSWGDVGRGGLLLLVVYPGVLGLLGGVMLSRRELALPAM